MRLLLDEMISGVVVERLRERGHDVIAVVADPELRSLDDPGVFAFAGGEDRALVTYNYRDFIAIAREHVSAGQEHAGLVFVLPTNLPRRELSRLAREIERLLVEFRPYPSFEAWIPLS